MRKVILLFIALTLSSIGFSNEVRENSKDCSIFFEEGNIMFEPFFNIINFKLKEGTTICKIGKTIGTFDFKNGKLIKYKEESTEGQLMFYGEFNTYGLTGEVYVNEGYGFGYPHSVKMNFVNGKPAGEVIEYYTNGKIYKKSNINSKSKFKFNDFYESYIDGKYEIYDMETGAKIYEGEIIKGTGKIVEYSTYGGKSSEYYIKNRKREGIYIDYGEKGIKNKEIIYANDKIVKEISYYPDGSKKSERGQEGTVLYNKNHQITYISLEKEGTYKKFNNSNILVEETKFINRNGKRIRLELRYYQTGELKYILEEVENSGREGSYTLYDKKGEVLFKQEITTGNEEIKYVKNITDGRITLGTLNLDHGRPDKMFFELNNLY